MPAGHWPGRCSSPLQLHSKRVENLQHPEGVIFVAGQSHGAGQALFGSVDLLAHADPAITAGNLVSRYSAPPAQDGPADPAAAPAAGQGPLAKAAKGHQ